MDGWMGGWINGWMGGWTDWIKGRYFREKNFRTV